MDTYTGSKDNAIKELQIVPEYVKESKGDHADSAGALIVREVLILIVTEH